MSVLGAQFEQTRVHNMVPLPSWPDPYEVWWELLLSSNPGSNR